MFHWHKAPGVSSGDLVTVAQLDAFGWSSKVGAVSMPLYPDEDGRRCGKNGGTKTRTAQAGDGPTAQKDCRRQGMDWNHRDKWWI